MNDMINGPPISEPQPHCLAFPLDRWLVAAPSTAQPEQASKQQQKPSKCGETFIHCKDSHSHFVYLAKKTTKTLHSEIIIIMMQARMDRSMHFVFNRSF